MNEVVINSYEVKARRIVLAGGSGFLGSLLVRRFIERGNEVVVLTRLTRLRGDCVKAVAWNGKTLGDWVDELEGAEALINLSGRSVNCRYDARNRTAIMDSRVNSTRVLGEAVAQCATPPRVWLNASTGTIYGHTFETPMDESGEIRASPEAKDGFSIEVAKAWETAFNEAQVPHSRKVTLRMVMVLGPSGNSVFLDLVWAAKWGTADNSFPGFTRKICFVPSSG
jgi:uncharacterized protein